MAQDYKKAQIQGTASTGTYATLYTTPAGKQALISTILVCNTDVNNPVTVRVGFDDTAGTPDSALGEWLVYDAVVAAGDTLTLSLGISMDQQKFLRVSSSNTNANFTAFVVEIGASGNSILPAFGAYVGTTQTDVTGDGTIFSLQYDTEIFDQGADFNTGTYTFTAPVTGRYMFTAGFPYGGLVSAHSHGLLQFITSNRTYYIQQNLDSATSPDHSMTMSALVEMDAGDTCYINGRVSGSTKVVDVNASANTTWFSGHLVA